VFAAAVVAALDPWAVLAPGFWLSVGAVAAIFLALHARPAQRERTWHTVVLEACRVQMVVTVALVPLTVVLFQQVSLVSPLANALARPVVSLMVTPLALAAACFVVFPEPFAAIAVPLLAFAHALMWLLAEFLQWIVQWRLVSIALPAPPAWAACVAVLGVAWLLAPPAWPARWAGAVWLLPLFLWPAERPRAGQLWVTALDVGQGAALVVETPSHVLVYDSGPRYSPQVDAGSRIVVPYLRTRGIDRIDLLVVSHLDSDHSGGAASILKAIDVAAVLTSIDPGHPVLANARFTRRCRAGDGLMMGPVAIRILHPTEASYALPARNTNARSCVLGLDAGGTRVLLTGDLPAKQESELLALEPDMHAILLTAPHHGSRHSSTEPFVRAVAPTWVVAQMGYHNRFGHPDPIVAERYRAVGSTLIRSDVSGAAQWRFAADGSARVVQQRRDSARYWHNHPRDEPPARDAVPQPAPGIDEPTGTDGAGLEVLSPRD
jgi:competence protein ComEC